MFVILPVLGVVAGVLTTLAGQGGGLFLLVACSSLLGPHAALAVTAAALFLGNVHRAAYLRRSMSWTVVKRMVAGALPGALAGALFAGVMPAGLLSVFLVVLSALAIVRALGWLRFAVPPWAFVPAGLSIGFMTGTSGGAGVLVAPVLVSAGLTGRALASTSSVIACAIHLGRIVSYAASGAYTRELVVPTVLVSIAIFVGNRLAERMRGGLSARANGRLELVVVVSCAGIALTHIR